MKQRSTDFYKKLPDGLKMFVRYWPNAGGHFKGTILIVHGLGETADYYNEFADAAQTHGFEVIVPELRGHGRTAGDIKSPQYKLNVGNPGPDSLHKMADDISLIAAERKSIIPNKPVFLLGHSMGSVAAQLSVMKNGDLFDSLFLTGLPYAGDSKELLKIVEGEIAKRGLKEESKETFGTMFGEANKPFEPAKTPIDWITSDEAMIRKSLALPFTSVMFNNEFYRDFLSALLETLKPSYWLNVPKQLPIFLLVGEKDVMSKNGESVSEKRKMLKSLGFSNIHLKIYPEQRHSILRDKNRGEVMDDIFRWIEIRLKIRMCRV